MNLDDFPIHPPRDPGMPTALSGMRVVDFTHFLAGPFATMMLADMGAEIIKVEPPAGDEFRRYPPHRPELPDQGAPFMWANRNKRSIALDLKTDAGIAAVRDLIAKADVVVENFSTGVVERLGIGYESCREANPGVIYCSVSAYGREGKFADRVGVDPIAQAESGFMSLNGYPDRDGVRAAPPIADVLAGLVTCSAILGATVAKQKTGVGQYVEVALFDSAFLLSGYHAMQNLLVGHEPARHGNSGADTCPAGTFHCQDNVFYLHGATDRIFRKLVQDVLGMPHLADDPRYAARKERVANRDLLVPILQHEFLKRPWSHWEPLMRGAGVPCGPVRTVPEAIRAPEARERHIATKVRHPKLGWVGNLRLPIKFSRTPLVDPGPAPSLGEHTDEILREIGRAPE